jgi:hypothetical protein
MNTHRLSRTSLGFALAFLAISSFCVAQAEARGRGGRVAGGIVAGVILGAIISEAARSSEPPPRKKYVAPRHKTETRRTTSTRTRPATVRTSSETRERPRPTTTAPASAAPASEEVVARPELPGGEGTDSTVSTSPAPRETVSSTSRGGTPPTGFSSDAGANSKVPD